MCCVHNPEGQLSFHGHQGDVWGTVLDPVSPTIASYGTDRNVRFGMVEMVRRCGR